MITRPIVYGSSATLVSKNDTVSDPSHTHKWKVYLKGVDGEDISYFIDKVVFKLHESFVNAAREVKEPPYVVSETGWGEFDILITIYFLDNLEPPLSMHHMLQLHPKEDQLGKKSVISEHYDEIVFANISGELLDALNSNPLESILRPHPSSKFNADVEQADLDTLQSIYDKIQNELESRRAEALQLEHEIKK